MSQYIFKTRITELSIRFATKNDVPIILHFIQQLADYEKLADEVVATETLLQEHLFGKNPTAEVILAEKDDRPVGFALFFHNFSTFLGRPGIYLEDLFVWEADRGNGYGFALLQNLARLAVHRNCGRLEWSVLNWNEPAIKFYEQLDARAMDGWTTYRLAGESLNDLANPE